MSTVAQADNGSSTKLPSVIIITNSTDKIEQNYEKLKMVQATPQEFTQTGQNNPGHNLYVYMMDNHRFVNANVLSLIVNKLKTLSNFFGLYTDIIRLGGHPHIEFLSVREVKTNVPLFCKQPVTFPEDIPSDKLLMATLNQLKAQTAWYHFPLPLIGVT